MMVSIDLRRKLSQVAMIALILFSLSTLPGRVQAADSVVGSGTAASCADPAFDNAYFAVSSSGGGKITFNCGAAPYTFVLAFQHPVMGANIEIDGGDLITLSGGNTTTLFQVSSGNTFTINHITLSHGHGTIGGVENFGTFNANNSQLVNNESIESGGAILNHNILNLTNVVIANNIAAKNGGGIHTNGGTTTITNSQFTGNSAFSNGGGIGVEAGSSLAVTGSLFTSNTVTDTFAQGGGIAIVDGAATINQSTFTQNFGSRGGGISLLAGTASLSQDIFTVNYSAYGGAIRQEGGVLTLANDIFSGNGYALSGSAVNTGGGGISFGGGDATLTDVTMRGNWATYGGGFDHDGAGTATLTNVTISNNKSVGSAAFDQSAGTVALVNVTISGNSAPFYGGVGNRAGTLTAKNTLLTNNFNTKTNQSENCYLPIAANSFSQSSDSTCNFGTGHDDLILPLRPLAYNGGFTQTMLLGKGSPAVDAGTGAGCPPTDQRGVVRPQGAACDVGAVEMTPADFLLKAFLPIIHK